MDDRARETPGGSANGAASAGRYRPVPRRLRPRAVPILSSLIYRIYWWSPWRGKQFWRWLLYKIEGGSMFSITLRRIFRRQFGVEVGDYTHGGWIHPFHIDAGTRIGRFCSIAETARTVTHNHPTDRRSTSALFYHPAFGLARENAIEPSPLEIGSDVWIGHNAVILPPVRSIGHGAVIGAGAVVTRDVPPYAIVMGYPARVIGYRFGRATIERLLASRWWEKPLEELVADLEAFQRPEPDEAPRPAPPSP
ncbi:MAG: hypothetical protein Fur0037_16860 [Planctomycetota bacterium]